MREERKMMIVCDDTNPIESGIEPLIQLSAMPRVLRVLMVNRDGGILPCWMEVQG